MTTYTWPTTNKALLPQAQRWRQLHNNRASTSALSGYTQTLSLPGARWGLSMEFPAHTSVERRQLEGMLTRLSGMEHRALLVDFARLVPRGSCNLTGVTLGANAAQFATSLVLAGCGASTTLLAGDWLGLSNGQRVQVVADASANGGGAMTVEVRHPLRAALSSGAALVLDKPASLFILSEPTLDVPWGAANICPAFNVDFIEVFA